MAKKLIVFLLVMLCLVGCGKHSSAETIKIGAILELTGSMPEVGKSAKNAAEMAVEELNGQGGVTTRSGKMLVQLVMEDNAADPVRSAQVAKKLIQQDHVVAIVGPDASVGVIPAAEVAEAEKTLLVAPWSTATATTADTKTGGLKQYVFRTSYDDEFENQVLANFARYTKNYQTAAILYDANEQEPAEQAKLFKQKFEELGGKVVVFEAYKKTNTQNFLAAPLAAVKAARPDVLFLPDYYGNVGLIAKSAKKMGIKAELLGSDNWNHPEFIFALKRGALESAYFTSHYSPKDPSLLTQAFVAQYKKRYGATPDDVAALTYDSYQILFKAIAAANALNSQAIRDSLWALPIIEGVTGTLDFKRNLGGNPRKSAVIVQVKGDKIVWVTYANP